MSKNGDLGSVLSKYLIYMKFYYLYHRLRLSQITQNQ